MEEFLVKYRLFLAIGLVGLIVLGLGVIFLRSDLSSSTQVEIISSDSQASGLLVCDIEGAVEKPGVYQLPGGSRINDLLIQAGGLAAEADRDWVAKNINLAQELTDGGKFYIYSEAELVAGGSPEGVEPGTVAGVVSRVNINTASFSQLDSLWGIGEARAKAIIANRPYQTLEELRGKANIPANVYEQIKDQISLY